MASALGGMACASSGLGAAHALGYPLDTRHRVSHGRSTGVFLPHVVRFNAASRPERVRRLAALVGGEDLAGWMEECMDQLRIPRRLRDYGVTRESVPDLAEEAWRTGQRLLADSARVLGVDDAVAICERAW